MRGGPRPGRRPDDRRHTAQAGRTAAVRLALASQVMTSLIDRGVFNPKITQIAEIASRGTLHRHWQTKRRLLGDLARLAPERVVAALGLSAEARAALSERDRAGDRLGGFAGKRLEAGE